MEQIRYFVMDADGTLVEDKICIIEENIGEVKFFSAKDEYGIKNLLIPKGIIPIVISQSRSTVLEKHCNDMGGIQLYQGIADKAEFIKLLLRHDQLCVTGYIGDDEDDYDAMLLVKYAGGVVGCPKNAVRKIKEIADFISTRNGGGGSIREFIEWLL